MLRARVGENWEGPELRKAVLGLCHVQAVSQADERGLARSLYILPQGHNLMVDPMRTNYLTSL